MAKQVPLHEVNAMLKRKIAAQYGPNFSEAAKEIGISPSELYNDLRKERKERKPGKLLDKMGFKYLTFVVPAGAEK